MKEIKYLNQVENLKNKISSLKEGDFVKSPFYGLYLTISANLSTYFPDLDSKIHFETIQKIQFHRGLSTIDQHFQSLLDHSEIHDYSKIVKNSLKRGHIFVTYHTGSYRMFIQHLTVLGGPFCLVTQEKFIAEQGPVIQKLFKQANKNSNVDLEILPAENPRLIFNLIKRLRQNISVVFYIDGNIGSSNKKPNENKNLLKINFLNHHIYARQGIAMLAYLSKAPIGIAIAKRDSYLKNILEITPLDTRELFEKHNRTNFVNKVTQKLYAKLEDFLIENFEQWEGWFYIDKFFEVENIKEEDPISKLDLTTNVFNLVINDFIHLIRYNESKTFLVKRKEYQILKITNFLFEVLSYFKKPQSVKPNEQIFFGNQIAEWSVIEELIELKFLKLT